MRSYIILLIILVLTLIMGCSKDKAANQISGLSSQDLYLRGWTLFQQSNYSEAAKYFQELSIRPNNYLFGHLGLGWTYLKQDKIINSNNEFQKFFDTDSLDLIVPADSSYMDGKAGLCFVSSAMHDEVGVITNSQQIGANWSFRYDSSLNYQDIVLLKAMSYYAMGQFDLSLQMVQILDPGFAVDLTFSEGKILLANKIESLKQII